MDVPAGRENLRAFALQNKLIQQSKHLTNVEALLNPKSGKKQLQNWQPLEKLHWLAEVSRDTLLLIPGRDPEPVLGKLSYFVEQIAPRIADMEGVVNHRTLGQYLSPDGGSAVAIV